jgi:hypothetical protein
MNILSSKSNGVAKEIRGFLGSVLIFGFICSIIVLLIQFPVLETNKEVVMLLLGSVGASIPLIISSITGTKKDDLEALKLTLDKKELQIDLLVKAKDNLEEMLQNQDMMLDIILLKNAIDFDDKNNPPKGKL